MTSYHLFKRAAIWVVAMMTVSVIAVSSASAEAEQGEVPYKPLFEEDLSNVIFTGNEWKMEDGILSPQGKGDIWTKKMYGDYIIELEFKCAEDTNSGVLLRCDNLNKWVQHTIEVQILQPDIDSKKNSCGGIFDVLAPHKRAVKPAGEWNHYRIVAVDNWILVTLNGEEVTQIKLDKWEESNKNPDGSKNKFKTALKDMSREGHIGLQYHGNPVWFRNIKILELD